MDESETTPEPKRGGSRDPEIEGHSPADLFRAAGASEEPAPPPSSRAPASTAPGAWEPPSPAEVDALIPGLEITELIGRGGMGAVYRGLQTNLERAVAIKLLPPELAADPEFEARFRREAKSMAKLDHPHIVQIYDFDQTAEGHFYFVMEYVDGTDLHHLIRGGHLDTTGVLNAICQICDALSYAHENGFVHRDIKPANIFINSKGILKVGDFGLAKLVEGDEASLADQIGLTQTGFAMGTPHYVAPEQLLDGTIDQRADIYSLGVMFYEMLTGGLPMGNFKPPSGKVEGLDPRLDGIVARAMEENPTDRYQSTAELRADSTAVLTSPPPATGEAVVEEAREGLTPSGKKLVFGDAPPTASSSRTPIPDSSPPAATPSRSRRPVLLAVGLIVPLLAVGVVVFLQTRGDAPDPPIPGDPPGEIAETTQKSPPTPAGPATSSDAKPAASASEVSSTAVPEPASSEESGEEEPVLPRMAATPAADTPSEPKPAATVSEADSPPSPVESTKTEPAPAPAPAEPLASTPPAPGKMPTNSPATAEPATANDPVDQRLEEIDAKYRGMFEAPYREALSRLNTQFSRALERQEQAAMQSGSLALVTAFRDEANRIGNGDDAGPVDEADSPPELRQLRQTWHDQVGRLREQRLVDKAKADAALDQALLVYQQELVKEQDLEAARRVAALRDAAAKTAGAPAEGPSSTPDDSDTELEMPLWLRKAREAGGKVRVWGMIQGEEIDERTFTREFTGSNYQKVLVAGQMSGGVLGVRSRGTGVHVQHFCAKDTLNPTGEAGHLRAREHDEVGALDRRSGIYVADGQFWAAGYPNGRGGDVREKVEITSGFGNPWSVALENGGGIHFRGVDPNKPEMGPFFESLQARIEGNEPVFVTTYGDRVYWQGADLGFHGVRIDRQKATAEDLALETRPAEPLRLMFDSGKVFNSGPRGWIALGKSGKVYSEIEGGFEKAVEAWSPALEIRSVSKQTYPPVGVVIARPDGTWLPVDISDPELLAFLENLGPALDLDAWLLHDGDRKVVTRVVAWIEPDSGIR